MKQQILELVTLSRKPYLTKTNVYLVGFWYLCIFVHPLDLCKFIIFSWVKLSAFISPGAIWAEGWDSAGHPEHFGGSPGGTMMPGMSFMVHMLSFTTMFFLRRVPVFERMQCSHLSIYIQALVTDINIPPLPGVYPFSFGPGGPFSTQWDQATSSQLKFLLMLMNSPFCSTVMPSVAFLTIWACSDVKDFLFLEELQPFAHLHFMVVHDESSSGSSLSMLKLNSAFQM